MTENLNDQWMQHFPLIYQTETVPLQWLFLFFLLQTTGDISTVSAEAQVTDTHNDSIACNAEKRQGVLILYNINNTFHMMEHSGRG